MKSTDAELWAAYQKDRSVENRNRLVEFHIPMARLLAGRIAGKIKRRSSMWDWDSITAEGVVGLVKAIEGFDPSRGIRFSTYASRRINGEIRDAFRRAMWATRWGHERGYQAELHRMPDDLEYEVPDREHVEPDYDWMDNPLTAGLGGRAKSILKMYFEDDMTMKQIGEVLGVVESRVSQLIADIIGVLKVKAACTRTA